MLSKPVYIYPNIIAMMAINGDTIRSLAKHLGIGYQALSARLRGRKSFELPEIVRLMERYDCEFAYLFSTSNQSNPA